MQETQGMWVRSLGQKDPLEEGRATHSNILAWRIPGTEDGLQSIESQRIRNYRSDLARAQYVSDNSKLLNYPSFLSPLVIIRLFSMSVGIFLMILFLKNENLKLENRLSSIKKKKKKRQHVIWQRDQLPTPLFCPGEFYGLYSPWGCKESDITE